MSISLEEVIIRIGEEDSGPVTIPRTREGIENWILKHFGLVIEPSVDFIRNFGGMTENVRARKYMLTSIHVRRQEKDVLTDDPERMDRRILAVSEMLSLLKCNYLADSWAIVRFWARGKDDKLWVMGINHSTKGLHLFLEAPLAREFYIGTIIVRIMKEPSKG